MNLTRDEKDFLQMREAREKDSEQLLAYYRESRKKGVPHQYLSQKVEFLNITVTITEDCLIPRQETEILTERALLRIPKNARVLDLCCGSGAIGLAIKKERSDVNVTLSDVSETALEVARVNAKANNLDVKFVQGDFLDPLAEQNFDVIVCNPPYISLKEYRCLDRSVKDFEPRVALTDEADGLSFYQRLQGEAYPLLTEGGALCLEIGKDQGESLKAIFKGCKWKNVQVEKDYSSHDRFFFCEKG